MHLMLHDKGIKIKSISTHIPHAQMYSWQNKELLMTILVISVSVHVVIAGIYMYLLQLLILNSLYLHQVSQLGVILYLVM